MSDDPSVSVTNGESKKLIELDLPSRWNPDDTHPGLAISEDGLQITMVGDPITTSCDSAATRADKPVPSRSVYQAAGGTGVYYYEVEVLNLGPTGPISIGFGASSMRLTRTVGWEGNSWAVHTDDGKLFYGRNDHGAAYSNSCAVGDVIGCGIDYTRDIFFFTKNGEFQGRVYYGFSKPSEITVFPAIGTRSPSQSVRANFGEKPFVWDIAAYEQAPKGMVPDGW